MPATRGTVALTGLLLAATIAVGVTHAASDAEPAPFNAKAAAA